MVKLAKKLDQSAVVFLGAHVQKRNDEAVQKLLKSNGCVYPVYQGFQVVGVPQSSSIPHAYVINHNGQCVWNGNPLSEAKDFENAIEVAVKALPKRIPGSLASGVNLVYCKDMASRLRIGQNIEPALRQLETRVAKGGAMAEEARTLITRCNTWAAEMMQEIQCNLAEKPSAALAAGRLYCRTFPVKAAAIKDELIQVMKDGQTRRLAMSRQVLQKLRQAKVNTANARKQLLEKVNFQIRQLGTMTEKAGDTDMAEVKALWNAFATELEGQP